MKYLSKKKVEIIENEINSVEMCMLHWSHGEMGYRQTKEELDDLEERMEYLKFLKEKIMDGSTEAAIIKELNDEIQLYAIELDYANRGENGYDYSYEVFYARQAEQKQLVEKRNYIQIFIKSHFGIMKLCGAFL